MVTMAPYSQSTLRQSPDRNVVTASPEERTSVWSSLHQRLERYPFTLLVPAEIQRIGTTWIRQCFTLAESSSQVGSHLKRYGRILNLLIILGKRCIHDNLISLRFLCVLCVSAVPRKARTEKPPRRRERRDASNKGAGAASAGALQDETEVDHSSVGFPSRERDFQRLIAASPVPAINNPTSHGCKTCVGRGRVPRKKQPNRPGRHAGGRETAPLCDVPAITSPFLSILRRKMK